MQYVRMYVVESQCEGCGAKRRIASGSRIFLSCSQLLFLCVSLLIVRLGTPVHKGGRYSFFSIPTN